MTRQDYETQRQQLLNQMESAIEKDQLEQAESLREQVTNLDNKFTAQRDAAAQLDALRGNPVVPPVQAAASAMAEEQTQLGADSKEYRNAFLKYIRGEEGSMTRQENAAWVHTTTDKTLPLPTSMSDRIWDQVTGQHSLLKDVNIYKTGVVMEIWRHTGYAQGKAKSVAENTANEDAKLLMEKVTLSGKDYAMTVKLSYAELKMTPDALERYLCDQIAAGLGEAMSEDLVTAIRGGIAEENKQTGATAGKITYQELCKHMGCLKRVNGELVLYTNRETYFGVLLAMEDDTGRNLFKATPESGAVSTVLGAVVKLEDAIPSGTLLTGAPKQVVYNLIQDVMLERARDIETHKHVFSGYARGEGALMDAKSFSEFTVATGA